MQIEVKFHHMDRSEALETFVTEKVQDVIENVLQSRSHCHVMVFLNSEFSRVSRGNPLFQCEIEVRYPPRHDVFVRKVNNDMHIAITEATSALRTLLREEGKREQARRHQAFPI